MTGNRRSGRKPVQPGVIKRLPAGQFKLLVMLYDARGEDGFDVPRGEKVESIRRLVSYKYVYEGPARHFDITQAGIDRLLDPKKLLEVGDGGKED